MELVDPFSKADDDGRTRHRGAKIAAGAAGGAVLGHLPLAASLGEELRHGIPGISNGKRSLGHAASLMMLHPKAWKSSSRGERYLMYGPHAAGATAGAGGVAYGSRRKRNSSPHSAIPNASTKGRRLD